MHHSLVAILADKFLDVDMARMARRTVHRNRSLGDIVPMTLHAGLPGCCFSMRLRRLAVRREHELDQQPVLLDDAELMTLLADDVPMAGQLPGPVCLFHEVTAAAELRILLDIRVIADSKDNAEYANNEQDRDENDLIAGTEPRSSLSNSFSRNLIILKGQEPSARHGGQPMRSGARRSAPH